MKLLNGYKVLWIPLLILACSRSALSQVDIDTRVGSGADSEIANDDPTFGAAFADDTQGTLQPDSMNIRFLNDFAARRNRAALMRFDIAGVSGDVSGAGITVHSVQQSRRLEVYGLLDTNDDGIEDWDESTITYNTAPGITNLGSDVLTGVVDPARYTFLESGRCPALRPEKASILHL